MTDNEIIKALECCCSEEIQCRNCPLPQNVKDGLECGTVIAKECLDLINRQKAEIEDKEETIQFADNEIKKLNAEIYGLKTANEKMYEAGKEQEAEIERLKYKVNKWKENYESSQVVVGDFREIIYKQAKNLETAKAEAVKEFAERLKQYLLLTKNGEISVIAYENIDYLVKEMVGDDK